jgi:hypothetical protein
MRPSRGLYSASLHRVQPLDCDARDDDDHAACSVECTVVLTVEQWCSAAGRLLRRAVSTSSGSARYISWDERTLLIMSACEFVNA